MGGVFNVYLVVGGVVEGVFNIYLVVGGVAEGDILVLPEQFHPRHVRLRVDLIVAPVLVNMTELCP